MKRLSIVLLVALLSAWTVPAAEETAKPAQKPKDDSALVDAAKTSKKTRKKSTTKVLTNADVKKSSGKIVVVDRPAPPAVATSSIGPITQHENDRKAQKLAEEIVAAEEKNVAELQAELLRIEQTYYDENDPHYRDEVIQKRFEQTRRQLEEARKSLADARDAANRASTPKAP
jgi:hypothetical protein